MPHMLGSLEQGRAAPHSRCCDNAVGLRHRVGRFRPDRLAGAGLAGTAAVRPIRAPHHHDHVTTASAGSADGPGATAGASTSGRGLASAPPPSSAATSSATITFEEVQAIAAQRGLKLSLETLGPLYQIEVLRPATPTRKEELLGLTKGFVAPALGLMHCDTLQVFTQGLGGDEGQVIRGGPFGLGLLLGGATFAHGLACGCAKAEILAILDDDHTHRRLVTYYKYFGFVPVKEVRSRLADLGDLLVWGGEGMRMDADVGRMLRRWTPMLRKQALQAGAGADAAKGGGKARASAGEGAGASASASASASGAGAGAGAAGAGAGSSSNGVTGA